MKVHRQEVEASGFKRWTRVVGGGVRREEFFWGLLVREESEAPRAGAGGVVAELPGSLFNSQDTCLWP